MAGPNVLDNCILNCEKEFADCKYSSGTNLGINANDVGRNRADAIPKNIANKINIHVCTGIKNSIIVNIMVLITRIDIFAINNFFGFNLSNNTPPIGTNINLGTAAKVSKIPSTIVESVKSMVNQDSDRK